MLPLPSLPLNLLATKLIMKISMTSLVAWRTISAVEWTTTLASDLLHLLLPHNPKFLVPKACKTPPPTAKLPMP